MDQNDLMSALVTHFKKKLAHINYPAKTNMTMEHQTFEDVLNIYSDFSFSCQFLGVYSCVNYLILSERHHGISRYRL